MNQFGIWEITNPDEEKFLRRKTREFSFGGGAFACGEKKFTVKELADLITLMKRTMRAANGIGLAANQIGLSYRLFVAEVNGAQGEKKFYAVLNPELEISETGGEDTAEEGCLSVPGKYGNVTRSAQVTLRGLDKQGRPLKIKAWGLLARVFQHETDHLNGSLFIDRATQIQEEPRSARLRKRLED